MENYRVKQFLSSAASSCMTKSTAVLLSPSQEVNHPPPLQCIHPVYSTHPALSWSRDPQCPQAEEPPDARSKGRWQLSTTSRCLRFSTSIYQVTTEARMRATQ